MAQLTGNVQNQLGIDEHHPGAKAKKVVLQTFNAGTGLWENAGSTGDGAILDGVSSSIKATVLDYTNSNPLAVRLTNTDGDYVAAGAGTQYTEGDTDASITGNALLFEGGSNTLIAATGDATNGLDVDVTRVSGNVAVTNAGLTELAAAINASSQMDVNIAAGNITGFATSAKQDTVIGHLDGVEGLLTTIDSDTGTLAGAVSGSEMQVDIVGALPAGTAAIGKLTQPATPTLANVTMTGSSVTLQASNTARRNLMIFNDSGVTVYVKLGSTASSTSFTVKMVDQAYFELPEPVYTGVVTALGASGDVRVSEVT